MFVKNVKQKTAALKGKLDIMAIKIPMNAAHPEPASMKQCPCTVA